MKKIANDFKGVIHVGKTRFTAGKAVPESFMEKMDMDSLMEDGIVVEDEKKTISPASTGGESGEGTPLEDRTRAELLAYANEELELGIPVRTGKEVILEKIREKIREVLEQEEEGASPEDPASEDGEDPVSEDGEDPDGEKAS